MANGDFTEKVEIKDNQDNVTINLDANAGVIDVKRSANLPQSWGAPPLKLNPYSVFLLNSDGFMDYAYIQGILSIGLKAGEPRISLNGKDGTLALNSEEDSTQLENRICLDAKTSTIYLGIKTGGPRISLDGRNSILTLSSVDQYSSQLVERIRLNAGNSTLYLGGWHSHGKLLIYSADSDNKIDNEAQIQLDGESGDIKLKGADCAEDFNVLESEHIEPGMVLVIDQEGILRPCKVPYDKRVVGVVSGAGDCRPGIVLDKRHSQNRRVPLALAGKVYCKVDAEYSSIEAGDLLTTSPTSGYAMKADDSSKAFGAVIGKAMQPLKEGKSIIPIIVALQ